MVQNGPVVFQHWSNMFPAWAARWPQAVVLCLSDPHRGRSRQTCLLAKPFQRTCTGGHSAHFRSRPPLATCLRPALLSSSLCSFLPEPPHIHRGSIWGGSFCMSQRPASLQAQKSWSQNRRGEASNPGPIAPMPGDGHCLHHALGRLCLIAAMDRRRLLASIMLEAWALLWPEDPDATHPRLNSTR